MYKLTFFLFNDTSHSEIYTLSLHDALPIWSPWKRILKPAGKSTRRIGNILRNMTASRKSQKKFWPGQTWKWLLGAWSKRSEEHTSELQSHSDLVCRLLLEKKKKNNK